MNLSYAIWLTVSGGVALWVAWLAWRRREAGEIALAFCALMLTVVVWSWTYAVSWIVPSETAAVFWLKMTYLGVVTNSVGFLSTTLYFTNYHAWLTRKTYALLTAIPLLTLVFLWTDDWHHLFFGDFPLIGRGSIFKGGPWFYVNAAYLYGLSLAGLILLIRAYLHAPRLYKNQAGILLLGALLPWLVNILMFLGVKMPEGLDLTPVAFTGTGLFFAYGIFAYRLIDLIPISRDVLVENMDDAVLVVDTRWRVVDLNPKALLLADPGVEAPIGKPLAEVFSRWRHIYADFAEVDGQIEVKLDRPPFSTLDLRVTTLKDRQGRVLGKLAIWRDISAIKQTEERLRIFLRAVEQNPTAILITDTNGNIEYVNPQLTRLTGYGLEELRGRTPRVFKSGEMDDRLYDDLWKTIQAGQIWEGELINRKKDGQLYWAHQWIAPVLDDRGQVTHYVAMQEDITPRKQFDEQLLSFNARLQEQLTEIETLHAQLREESIRDGLTRLFNRRYMEETLERELSSAGRASSPISVVIIDIDHFKTINDTYGHQAGDTVLQTLGTLLLENTRSGDIACRYGGDEMVVVMPGAAHQAAVARAEEWQALFAKIEFAFGDAQIRLTLSMGVASFPDHAQEPIQLLTAADKALYGAKSNRNQVRLYDPADAAFS